MAHPKGGLTGSKRFQKPTIEDPTDALKSAAQAIANGVQSVATGVQAATDTAKSVGKANRSIRNSFKGGSALVTSDVDSALDQANVLASTFGLETLNLKEALVGNPYQSSDSIPELKAADANREKLKIQRQNNALDVRLEKVKQGRKLAAIAQEERRLVGDLVDYATVGIETATKVVKNKVADTRYQIEQSKLEQTEEQLEQQQIATQGTLNLTEGIRHEWQLKFENQQAKNDRLRLEIEGTIQETDRKREELEAKLLIA
jgi:hypothetical protein